jgi:hypothetical protein
MLGQMAGYEGPTDPTIQFDPEPLVWTDSRGGRWMVFGHWQVVNGRRELVGADISPADPEDPHRLTGEVLRELSLRTLADEGRRRYLAALALVAERAEEVEQHLGRRLPDGAVDGAKKLLADELLTGADAEADGRSTRRGGRKRRWGAEHYTEVAVVYDGAWKRGDPPTQSVADHFVVAKSTAAKRVSKAREFGFLPKTRRGEARGLDSNNGD